MSGLTLHAPPPMGDSQHQEDHIYSQQSTTQVVNKLFTALQIVCSDYRDANGRRCLRKVKSTGSDRHALSRSDSDRGLTNPS
jgi:hypothetical protein